ncbi:hypothetical protein C8R44DRAFT_754891 [Mycena epipterygia]|nr:hypothetical protein C8R44DRAFT_754891 [Mycena epipterygia]
MKKKCGYGFHKPGNGEDEMKAEFQEPPELVIGVAILDFTNVYILQVANFCNHSIPRGATLEIIQGGSSCEDTVGEPGTQVMDKQGTIKMMRPERDSETIGTECDPISSSMGGCKNGKNESSQPTGVAYPVKFSSVHEDHLWMKQFSGLGIAKAESDKDGLSQVSPI